MRAIGSEYLRSCLTFEWRKEKCFFLMILKNIESISISLYQQIFFDTGQQYWHLQFPVKNYNIDIWRIRYSFTEALIKIELNVNLIVDNLSNSVMSIQANADRKTLKSGYDNYSDSFIQGRTLSFSQDHKYYLPKWRMYKLLWLFLSKSRYVNITVITGSPVLYQQGFYWNQFRFALWTWYTQESDINVNFWTCFQWLRP